MQWHEQASEVAVATQADAGGIADIMHAAPTIPYYMHRFWEATLLADMNFRNGLQRCSRKPTLLFIL